MELHFLGTGGSWPTPQRNVSAVALRREGEVLLFDCGEGTQRQFMRSPVSFMDVSTVLLSHFHGDHFLGLPGLLQTLTFFNRERPLRVLGPPGTSDLVRTLARLGHFAAGFPIAADDLRDGDAVDAGPYWLRALASRHTVPALTFALVEKPRPGRFDLARAQSLGIPEGPLYRRLQAGQEVTVDGRRVAPEEVVGPPRRGRKVVYTSDTLPNDALVPFARGADVLVHDATAGADNEEKANVYGHSSARQAAAVAKAADVRTLVLTHISPRYEDATPLLEEARAVFPATVLAEDFLDLPVPLVDEPADPEDLAAAGRPLQAPSQKP